MFNEKGIDNNFKRTSSIMSPRKILLVVFILVLLFPFPTTIVPTWKLKVVEENGNICPNKEVTETWAHYSIYIGSGNSQSENRFTDREGYVEFPKRTVWSPLIWRIIGAVIANALTIAHGSAGPHSSIYSSGIKDVAWISYESDKPLVDKIVVHSCAYNGSY